MFSARIKTTRLAQFCRRVGTSLETGLDILRVMERETDRARRSERPTIEHLHRSVAAGNALSEAMAEVDSFFPPLVLNMVHVGEQAGKLDQALLRLAEHYDRTVSLRRTFLAGIVWPMLQLFAVVCIVGLLIWVMGPIGEMVGENIDLLGLGLIGTSGLMIYIAILFGIAMAGILLYKAVTSGFRVMRPLQHMVQTIPIVGTSLQTLALARMAWTLSVTTNTSMDTIRAVSLAIRNSQNVIFLDTVQQVAATIGQGKTIGEAFRKTQVYPPEFVDVIEVGEDTGQLSESMERLSRQYEDRAKSALAAMAVLASFLVWILVAALIIALIFRLALWYIDQINGLLDGI